MGESKRVVELKRKELVEELARPEWSQNKNKVRRLKESLDRHKTWERERKQAKLRRIKREELGNKFMKWKK